MKDLSELKTKQIRIFAADQIPFVAIRTTVGQKTLNELFSWTEVGTSPATGEIIFNSGTYMPEGNSPIIINSLQVSERRIAFEIEGDTKQGTLFFNTLSRALSQYDRSGRWKGAEPVVLVHETSCVAALAFDWTGLLSDSLLGFTNQILPSLSTEAATTEILGIKFSIVLSYGIKDPLIREHGITLTNKTLTIEPRVNAPLSERRYFTASPSDSDTHTKLLDKLEKMLSSDRSRVSKRGASMKARDRRP